MHRVELKELPGLEDRTGFNVPNAPCGVESCFSSCLNSGLSKFLMHRVELKDITVLDYAICYSLCVLNAPCGVERRLPPFS